MSILSRTLPLLPGIAFLAGCGSKAQKEITKNNLQQPNVIYIFAVDLDI